MKNYFKTYTIFINVSSVSYSFQIRWYFERVEKIKYNQTCLVYLAISNPLFIGSSTLVLFVPFLEFFYGFFYFLSCCFMKFNNRLFPSYDIVTVYRFLMISLSFYLPMTSNTAEKRLRMRQIMKIWRGIWISISKTKTCLLTGQKLVKQMRKYSKWVD